MATKRLPRINKICPICGSTYEAPPWAIKHNRNLTCSYKCGRKLTALKLSGFREPITITCKQCGKKIQLSPAKARNRKYCSRKCAGAARKGTKAHWNPKPIRITVNCARCNREIQIAPWRIKKSESKNFYCSRRCQHPPTLCSCDWCKKEFRKSPSAIKVHNFCCQKCCHAWQGENGIVRRPYAQLEVTCATCGKVFMRQRHAVKRLKKQYCSKKCFYIAHQGNMSGSKNPAWRGGLEPYYGPNWKRQARRARARDNHRCQRCNVSEIELGKKLHVHHIVPLREFNRNFRKANALANLVSLCPSCHKFLEWHEDQMNQFLVLWYSKT